MKRMKHSDQALELIKKWEGLKLEPYLCPAQKLTIGYGHSLPRAEIHQKWTQEKAESMLEKDIERVGYYLNSVLKNNATQGQFDALCSLVFNWGNGNFGQSKGLRYLNEGMQSKAVLEFFSKESGVVNINRKFCKGLYNRRQDELKLFNKKD